MVNGRFSPKTIRLLCRRNYRFLLKPPRGVCRHIRFGILDHVPGVPKQYERSCWPKQLPQYWDYVDPPRAPTNLAAPQAMASDAALPHAPHGLATCVNGGRKLLFCGG
jgi:hypothetical protein